MPPERTKELVDQLRAWYSASAMRQMDLAAVLSLRPQQLAEILAGRNRPTADQAFQILEFLKGQKMQTPTLPPGIADDDDDDCGNMAEEPKTLLQAKARIARKQREASFLQQRLAARSAGKPAAAASQSMPAAKASSSTGTFATQQAARANPAFTDGQNWSGKLVVTPFPPGCDNPRAIAEHIAGLSTPALRAHLQAQPKNETEKLQSKMTFAELQKRTK